MHISAQESDEISSPKVQVDRRQVLSKSAAAASLSVFSMFPSLAINPTPALAAYIDPSVEFPKITSRVYLDVVWSTDAGRRQDEGRITIGLFGDLMPKTTENFKRLCEENKYAGTTFYRIISEFSIQGGAIGDPSGKTGQSAFGNGFEPDNYNLQHTKAGLVSMVKSKSGSVDSRFFFQVNDNGGWADDRYAAFGIVDEASGLDILKRLERVEVQPPKNSPKNDVKIVASGVLPL